MLLCWNCGQNVSDEPLPLSRQASCQACGEFLHCCEQCTAISLRSPDGCSNQLADPPSNKTGANFCEYFIPKENYSTKQLAKNQEPGGQDAKSKLDALFGEDTSSTTTKNPLDDLFND